MSDNRVNRMPVTYQAEDKDMVEIQDYGYQQPDEDDGLNPVAQIFDTLHTGAMIEKANLSIAKKETDTCATVAKIHAEMTKRHIESLLDEKRCENLTFEQRCVLNDRIENALADLNEQENRARNQVENSPYRKSFPWKSVVMFTFCGVAAAYGGPRLYKFIMKTAA